MKYKIAVYQHELTGKITREDMEVLQKASPDFLCLPEYFFRDQVISHDDAVAYMKEVSIRLQCTLIGGTTVKPEEGKLFNTCYIVDRGSVAGHYKKVNLYFMEEGRITPGSEYKVFTLGKVRVGLLICADVLHEKAWQELAKLKPHLVFIPTFSPYKEEPVDRKFERDQKIFVKGAGIADAVVVKVCGIGNYRFTRLQGRSLAASAEGIIWRVAPEDEHSRILKIFEVDLDV